MDEFRCSIEAPRGRGRQPARLVGTLMPYNDCRRETGAEVFSSPDRCHGMRAELTCFDGNITRRSDLAIYSRRKGRQAGH